MFKFAIWVTAPFTTSGKSTPKINNGKPTATDNTPGFKIIDFEFDGLGAKVVKPNVTPNGLWAIKTEYFNAFPDVEISF